jgi:competence protein ComEC
MALAPRVDVLDVNQGDAIWIESPSCRMLIDTGDVDDYDTVLKSLLRRGIRKIDVLLITHRHADHDGELSDLIASITVDRLVFGRMPEQAFAASVEVVEAGQTLVCGELRFEVLSADRRADNENDNSIVLKGTIGNDVWLFMADAERAVEQELLRQPFEPVDIIKVGHHGGKTSTGLALLQAANPQIAIISVGRPNKYNHPHDDVLKRLEDLAIDVYRTDRNGTITIWTCGSLRIIQTAKGPNDRIWTFMRRIRIESR